MRPIHWTIIRTDLGQIEIAFFLGLLDGLCKLSQEFDCSLVRMASKDSPQLGSAKSSSCDLHEPGRIKHVLATCSLAWPEKDRIVTPGSDI